MPILYIHGFLSSPRSKKAQLIQQWMAAHHPDIEVLCPLLPPYPEACAEQLCELITRHQPLGLIGSSLGGFWATYLAERYHLKAVLINPAVHVGHLIERYTEQPLHNYYESLSYTLTAEHGRQMQSYEQQIQVLNHPDNYWLLAQMGDETLDYRHAVARYAQSRQTVEPGGDHSFQGIERYLEKAIAFFRESA